MHCIDGLLDFASGKKIRVGSNYIGQAVDRCLFTGAIPLLIDTGTFACCVSALGQYVPP